MTLKKPTTPDPRPMYRCHCHTKADFYLVEADVREGMIVPANPTTSMRYATCAEHAGDALLAFDGARGIIVRRVTDVPDSP